MAYAERTDVPLERSITEITALLKKAGASQIGHMEGDDHFVVMFRLSDRTMKITVPLPGWEEVSAYTSTGRQRTMAQRVTFAAGLRRQRSRALKLVIMAKLESVESGIETVEEAFLAHVVMADNKTVYQRVQEHIALEYRGGGIQPLLAIGGPS